MAEFVLPRTLRSLVAEVANSSEQHGEAEAIGGRDDFGIALRASGLDDGSGSGLGDFLDSIGEWEKGVGRGDRSLQGKLCFHGSDFSGIDAAHLAGADADSLSIAYVDDGVRLHMLADFPGKQKRTSFFGGRAALGDDLQVTILQTARIRVLYEDSAGNIF